MEKITVNQLFFEKNMPPPSEGFEERTMAMLRRQMTRESVPPARRMKGSTILAIGVAGVLLMTTALAVGLRWSARSNALRTARQAVMGKYGLTQETMAVFSESSEEERGRWTVRYMPTLFDVSAMGNYMAVIENGTAIEVNWSHDDTPEPEASGSGFDAPAWGQPQLESALEIRQAHQQTFVEGYNEPSTDIRKALEDAAERDRALWEGNRQGLVPFVMHVLPTQEDLQPEEAAGLAREAVSKKYGLPLEDVPAEARYMAFVKYADDEEPVYRMTLGDEKDETEKGTGPFWVCVFSPSGKIVELMWAASADIRTLPTGPLHEYGEAVEEFIRKGRSFTFRPRKRRM